MVGFLIASSAVTLLIFILSIPFDIKSHTAMSLGRHFVVENLNFLGIISLAFSIILKDGKLLFNGEILKKKKDSEKNEFKMPDINDVLQQLNIVSITVKGAFGNASDAASTAVVSASITMICALIKNTILRKTRKFDINIVPMYQKNILDFDVKIRLRVNIFIIFFTVLKILRKR